MNYSHDTIVALSTGNGNGAIGLIRLSGESAWEIVQKHFSKDILSKTSHTLHFGVFSDNSKTIIDEVVIGLFSKGKSYTGEAVVEISCHASRYIQDRILESLSKSGARLAEPGEFSQRAFLNGNLDLSQAEAVADLIASRNHHAHQLALKQLRGGISNELNLLRENLIHFASMIELELDFSEEDVEFADRSQMINMVQRVLEIVSKMIESFSLGNALKNGVPVAIVGAPNSGKSTLLNALLGEDRAIVSEIAGTTRDAIEDEITIEGIRFRFIDTAGIRETEETIEKIGIERAYEKISEAMIVIVLISLSDPQKEAQMVFAQKLQEQYPEKNILKTFNKADLAKGMESELLISAKLGKGMDVLKKKLVQNILDGHSIEDELIITNARHLEALQKTSFSLQKAFHGIQNNTTGDFIAMDIRQAMFHLGSITGAISNEDLLTNIFSKFCIGK